MLRLFYFYAKHMSRFHTVHAIQLHYAHQGPSDICILSKQNRCEFVSISDKHMFAIADLETTIYNTAAKTRILLVSYRIDACDIIRL